MKSPSDRANSGNRTARGTRGSKKPLLEAPTDSGDLHDHIRQITHQLTERVKELGCLYSLSCILEQPFATLGEALQAVVDILPPAWQYPDVACGRIVVFDMVRATANFRETSWRQAADILVDRAVAGRVEVCYLAECPPAGEGPFLPEERKLLEAIAQRLGQFIDHWTACRLLEERRSELAHASRLSLLGELAANITHEIKQPLATICTYLDALRVMPPEERQTNLEEVLGKAREQAGRAVDIVRQIRRFAAHEPGDRTTIDLNEIIDEALRLTQSEINQAEATVARHFEGPPPRVMGNRVEIQQILANLLVNALEAMRETPPHRRRLTVQTRTTATRAVVAVRDAGCGLPQDLGERIFDPFFTTRPNGTGLGLPLSRRIAQAHGGRLWAKPNPGGGTTFFLELPTETADHV